MPEEIADALKKAMEQCGMSMNQLAAKVGVNPSQLTRFMAGTRGLTLETADKLMSYFGFKVQAPKKPRK